MKSKLTLTEAYNLGTTTDNLFKSPFTGDKDFLVAWLTDLFTTKARQGRGVLRDTKGGFCCLGRCFVVAGVKPERVCGIWKYQGEHAYLSEETQIKIGLASWVGEFKSIELEPYKLMVSLADLNDEHGFSFKQIAAFVCGVWKKQFGTDLEEVRQYWEDK